MEKISEIGKVMKRQAAPNPGLPPELSQNLQSMIAGALMGQFGQAKVMVGVNGTSDAPKGVRILVFPDEIPMLGEPQKEEKKVIETSTEV